MKADHNGHGGGYVGGHSQGASDLSRKKSIEANYEVSDVELRGIIVFLLGLTVMTAVVYILMLLMFNLLNTREVETERKKQQSPLALSEKERMPPEPRLQSAPGFAEKVEQEVGVKEAETSAEREKPKDRTWELDQLQQRWADELKYGPKDKNGNPAGISIDQAEQQVLSGSGLPARARATSQAGAGGPEDYAIEMPTAASSGRMTEKRKQ
ncbi:MAG TPA: hypothetical protein VN920_13160 [Pyrinomonadaceae bacterium]|nr:hypothetical protein [Pyrinomonadaceae bacterium]